MSYIQGTVVRVTATFTDPDSGAPSDPPDVTATINRPNGTNSTRSYSGATITKVGVGIYRTTIDTTPESGAWHYEIGSTGTGAVRTQRTLRVIAALPTT